jgi:hypothetical protein
VLRFDSVSIVQVQLSYYARFTAIAALPVAVLLLLFTM